MRKRINNDNKIKIKPNNKKTWIQNSVIEWQRDKHLILYNNNMVTLTKDGQTGMQLGVIHYECISFERKGEQK